MDINIVKYYQEKIKVQTELIKEQAEEIEMMSQFLIDLLDPSTPVGYKEVVKKEIEDFVNRKQ